jgi:hypothetical protein
MMGLENDPTPHRLVQHGMVPTCSGPTLFTRCVCSLKMACRRLDLVSITVVTERKQWNTSFFRTNSRKEASTKQIHGKRLTNLIQTIYKFRIYNDPLSTCVTFDCYPENPRREWQIRKHLVGLTNWQDFFVFLGLGLGLGLGQPT